MRTLGVLGLADGVRLVLWQPRHVGASPYRLIEVRDHGSQVAGYLASYLFPFLAITEPKATDLVAYAIFLGLVGLIFVRSDLAEINPTLYLLGRRVLEITTAEGFTGYAVVRSALSPGDELRAVHLDQGVLVEVRR